MQTDNAQQNITPDAKAINERAEDFGHWTLDIGLSKDEVIAEETAAQLGTYAKLPIVVVRGEGILLYDASGKAYYDFYCGHAVTLLGHCPPSVVSAIQEQAARLIFYSNIVYNDVRAHYA